MLQRIKRGVRHIFINTFHMYSSLYHANNQGQGRYYTIAIEYNRSSKMRMPVLDIIINPHTHIFSQLFFPNLSSSWILSTHSFSPLDFLLLLFYVYMLCIFSFSIPVGGWTFVTLILSWKDFDLILITSFRILSKTYLNHVDNV